MTTDLTAFDRKLRAHIGGVDGRPFLCDGSPYGCEAFIVGINPGTDTPFWPYWTPASGCDKPAWLDAYRAKHGRDKPTRARIERIFDAARPTRILETNIFHVPSTRESHLRRENRATAVFDFLLKELRPRVLFVHGGSAVKHMEQLIQQCLGRDKFITTEYDGLRLDVIASHHLSYQWSFAAVDELGRRLHARCVMTLR